MKVAVVTTFSKRGWGLYSRRMIESFDTYWPKAVDLHCFPDEKVDHLPSRRVFYWYDTIPEKEAFIRQHEGDRAAHGETTTGYNYRFDAVKFCHKPFALWHFMRDVCPGLPEPPTYVIWMDADTLTHSPIPLHTVRRDMCVNGGIAYLGRQGKYSECGFMSFDKDAGLPFMGAMVSRYTTGAYRGLPEWHDSYIFDRVRERFEADPTSPITFRNISRNLNRRNGGGHPFVNTFLGQYMDHLKGDARKCTGRPKPQDNMVGHKQPYWKR